MPQLVLLGTCVTGKTGQEFGAILLLRRLMISQQLCFWVRSKQEVFAPRGENPSLKVQGHLKS